MISYLPCLTHAMPISLGLTQHPPKRQRSDSSDGYDKVKRQNVQVDESLETLATFGQCEASQVTTCTSQTHAVLQSSNARLVESSGSSWDPSQQASEVNKSDYFDDDSDLDQHLGELDETADKTLPLIQTCQNGDAVIIELNELDYDAFTELLDEAS
ncbi:hypothetical protein CEP54_013259 [Fusarium duplospermum]|uniref:Uncharacterized protein n=1 Tax=Fusarium duplospermum TaxID=1325734 RepID=A0A428P3V1_9HYPO|nr:hypothetical protein CEP54_013259 [Fusarium duplospermum]